MSDSIQQLPFALPLDSPLAPVEVKPTRRTIRAPQRSVVDARIHGVPEFKRCRDCEQVKASDDFMKARSNKDGLSHYCKPCARIRGQLSWSKAPKEYKRNRARLAYERRVAQEFGITIDDYWAMYDAQNGLCAICGNPPGKKRLAVDHDHDTGTVRALLCSACNIGIGHLKDSSTLADLAAEYLRKHGK